MVTAILTLIGSGFSWIARYMAVPEHPVSPLIRLASAYGDAVVQSWCHALFAFDAQMANIVLTAREPMLAQIRLQWWHDVMAQPAGSRPAANPVLAALLALENAGLPLSDTLGPVVHGWQAALDLEDAGAIAAFSEGRGKLMAAFRHLAPDVAPDDLAHLGRCWALWDMTRCHGGAGQGEAMLALLKAELPWLADLRLPRRLRPLSIIGRAVLLDIRRGAPDRPWASPRLFAALVWHGLTGR